MLSNGALGVLTHMKTQYDQTNDPQEKLRLIAQLQQMKDQGQLVSLADNIALEIYVEFDLTDALTALNAQIASAIRSCQQENDR